MFWKLLVKRTPIRSCISFRIPKGLLSGVSDHSCPPSSLVSPKSGGFLWSGKKQLQSFKFSSFWNFKLFKVSKKFRRFIFSKFQSFKNFKDSEIILCFLIDVAPILPKLPFHVFWKIWLPYSRHSKLLDGTSGFSAPSFPNFSKCGDPATTDLSKNKYVPQIALVFFL